MPPKIAHRFLTKIQMRIVTWPMMAKMVHVTHMSLLDLYGVKILDIEVGFKNCDFNHMWDIMLPK